VSNLILSNFFSSLSLSLSLLFILSHTNTYTQCAASAAATREDGSASMGDTEGSHNCLHRPLSAHLLHPPRPHSRHLLCNHRPLPLLRPPPRSPPRLRAPDGASATSRSDRRGHRGGTQGLRRL